LVLVLPSRGATKVQNPRTSASTSTSTCTDTTHSTSHEVLVLIAKYSLVPSTRTASK
jgi:hypothetical protein